MRLAAWQLLAIGPFALSLGARVLPAQGVAARDAAVVEPWLGAALGTASEGATSVVSVGTLLSAQLGLGAEWQRTAPLLGDRDIRTRTVLGTVHWVVGRGSRARVVLRARAGREVYEQDGQSFRTALGGGGLGVVLLPRSTYSPVVAWDRAWRWRSSASLPRTTGSVVVGLLVH